MLRLYYDQQACGGGLMSCLPRAFQPCSAHEGFLNRGISAKRSALSFDANSSRAGDRQVEDIHCRYYGLDSHDSVTCRKGPWQASEHRESKINATTTMSPESEGPGDLETWRCTREDYESLAKARDTSSATRREDTTSWLQGCCASSEILGNLHEK